MAAGELQTVALSMGDLRWIVGVLFSGASIVAAAVWWLAMQFLGLRTAITDLQKAMAAGVAEAAGVAKNTDTRLTQHSERMATLDARLNDLERWRLRHVEDHK